MYHIIYVYIYIYGLSVSHVSIIVSKDTVGPKLGCTKNMYWYGCRPRAVSRTGNDKVT